MPLAMTLVFSALALTQPPTPHRSIDRRSAIFGFSTSLAAFWVPAPASAKNKMDASELAEIVERAKVGQLSTDRVIKRALQDNLIDPKDVNNCGALEAIRFIDLQTITELTPAQRGLRILSEASDNVKIRDRDRESEWQAASSAYSNGWTESSSSKNYLRDTSDKYVLREASDTMDLVIRRLNDQLARIQSETLSRSCDGRIADSGRSSSLF